MTSYGSDAEVQKLAFGATDSNQDTRTTSARDVATSIINAELDLKTDLSSVPNEITRCANLLAAGIILSGQITVDSGNMHPYYTQGMRLLKELKADNVDNSSWGLVLPVKRFQGSTRNLDPADFIGDD